MEGINERIAACIKDSGLTKTAFAKRINLSQPFVSQLTSGASAPSDRTITDICREFNISETWLRTGEGQMHIQLSEDSEFVQIMAEIQVSDDDFIKAALKAYWELSDNEKAAIRKLIDGIQKRENAGD